MTSLLLYKSARYTHTQIQKLALHSREREDNGTPGSGSGSGENLKQKTPEVSSLREELRGEEWVDSGQLHNEPHRDSVRLLEQMYTDNKNPNLPTTHRENATSQSIEADPLPHN